VQVAFIGSGAIGGGTWYFHGRSYPIEFLGELDDQTFLQAGREATVGREKERV
jgi:hypothetical protein